MPFSSLDARRLIERTVCALVVFATMALVPSARATGASVGTASARALPLVWTATGSVRGATAQNMNAYLGIPYAKPPLGNLRWRPPQPLTAWAGQRSATHFANHCPQGLSPFGIPSITEDCLYLNVFTPAGMPSGAKLPVMVWFHGGGFIDGESDDYNPDRLVARGVIVVTVNYRLGYLGFLATSGLDAEPHTHVNYGLLDQQAALQWTRTNIAAFGGDPARTTIFGQSAGGESVFTQLLAPSSAGLFSRAVVESGAYQILALNSLATAQSQGNLVAASLGCAPQDTACLRKVSVVKILALESGSGSPLSAGPAPAVDGAFITQPPEAALAAGAFAHVPIVQGSNHDEFRLFTALLFDLAGAPLTAAEYPLVVKETLVGAGLGAFTSLVLAQYPLSNYASPDLAFSALTTDAVFSAPTFLTDVLLSARVPLYAYEFSDENAPEDFLPPVSFSYAAAHGSELQFFFDSLNRVAPPLSPAEQLLAAKIASNLTTFAKDGNPNGSGPVYWPTFAGYADDMESVVAPKPRLFSAFISEHKTLFWAALIASQGPKGTLTAKHYLTLSAVRSAARGLRARGRIY